MDIYNLLLLISTILIIVALNIGVYLVVELVKMKKLEEDRQAVQKWAGSLNRG